MSARRPSMLSRIGNNIGPLVLLSVLTSVAFNRAILARERAEERRLHHLQMSLLHQIYSEASSSSLLSSSTVLSSLSEQKKLAKRLRTLHLDPIRLGFSRDVLPSQEEEEKLERARNASTTWGTALFGSGVAMKMKEAMRKASNAVREQGIGFGKTTDTSSEDAEDEEWLRALESSLDGSDRVQTTQAKAAASSSMNTTTQDKSDPSHQVSLREGDVDRATGSNGWSLSQTTSTPTAVEEAVPPPRLHAAERRRVYM